MSSVSNFDHDKHKIVVSLRVRGAACGIERVDRWSVARRNLRAIHGQKEHRDQRL